MLIFLSNTLFHIISQENNEFYYDLLKILKKIIKFYFFVNFETPCIYACCV